MKVLGRPIDAEILKKARMLYRGLEMQAAIMRDSERTRGWNGAERVASAFERQAVAAKAIHDYLAAAAPATPAVEPDPEAG